MHSGKHIPECIFIWRKKQLEDLSRNTDEVIMQIHNLFRYTDPIFRLTTIGTVKLIQFLARMAKEKQISQVEVEDFAGFLKATDGKYDIMNIPAVDKETLVREMDNLGVRFSIMPDLDKDDGLMQVAVYQPDRVAEPVKSLAETVTVRLKQPQPPVLVR